MKDVASPTPRRGERPREPRDFASQIERAATLPPGTDERFAGYGVMGLPFSTGHYLALRRFPASSVGGAYTAVWWRDPLGRWSIFSSVSPRQSCARYFGRALARAETRNITIAWESPRTLHVSVQDAVQWDLELGSSPATRLLSTVGGAAPPWMWRNPSVLHATALIAERLLQAGKIRLQGTVPNGQWFQASPRLVWTVTASRAVVEGEDAGPIGPLDRQARLGDLWLPQRGLYFVGEAYLEPFDAARHWSEPTNGSRSARAVPRAHASGRTPAVLHAMSSAAPR